MVVSIQELDCLDHLLWLRTGVDAARRLKLSQASVSRTAARVAEAFGLALIKPEGEWILQGDQGLLNLERLVHQQVRWARQLPLRLEAQYYSGPLFLDGADPATQQAYSLGNFNFIAVQPPLQLLRDGVLDGWIGAYPDVPDDDPAFRCFHLTRMPTWLVVSEGHPLLRLGGDLTVADLEAYPSLALPDGAFPKIEAHLRQRGLWSTAVRAQRYDTSKWEGRTADALTIGYASAFSLRLFDHPQRVLPLDVGLDVGDTLVVRSAFADHPRYHELLADLQRRARVLATSYPDVRLMFK